MKKVNWKPVGQKKEVAAAIDKFVKGDRVISNFGTQKEPEYYSGTVIMVSPKRVAVKVHYDDGEIHMEPIDGTGLGVIGFMKGKAKYKRAIPTERVLALIDQERWHVPAIKKLIKGQPTVENKVTPDIKRKHEIVEKIDNTLKNKTKAFEQVNAVNGVERNTIKAKILDLVGFRRNGMKDGPICVGEVEDINETGFMVEKFGSVPFEWYVGYVPFSKTQGAISTMSNTLTDQQFLDLVERYK